MVRKLSGFLWKKIFFYTQFKSFYKDELPKTLLTTHFTILQRRYPEEHNNLTTPTPFHKRHRTKLRLNMRLQKATYNQFTDNWHRIKEACFAVDVELTNSEPKLVGFGYWRSAVTPDINCEANEKHPIKEKKDFVTFTKENF